MPAQTPAKKTAARRTSDKPAPVGFNFDTFHNEESFEPFVIVLGGKRFESIVDPLDIDFRELLDAMSSDTRMFEVVFGEEAAAKILENKLSLRALAKFSEAISAHFGLEDFVAALS